MFGKYTDLVGTKTLGGALGFYTFFTIFFVGLSTVLLHILGVAGVGEIITGMSMTTLISSVWVLFLSTMVVSGKGLTKDLLSIVLVILGTYLAFKMGVIVGMIPVAILTMLKKS